MPIYGSVYGAIIITFDSTGHGVLVSNMLSRCDLLGVWEAAALCIMGFVMYRLTRSVRHIVRNYMLDFLWDLKLCDLKLLCLKLWGVKLWNLKLWNLKLWERKLWGLKLWDLKL